MLAEESHSLNNKKIEPKKAEARERIKKIFCGGFGPDVNEETLRTHFSQFGEIEKIEIPMKDQEKKLHKVRRGKARPEKESNVPYLV